MKIDLTYLGAAIFGSTALALLMPKEFTLGYAFGVWMACGVVVFLGEK